MTIADFVLQKTLTTNGLLHLLWTRVRRLLITMFHDPACSLEAHGRRLLLPLSHELPTYLHLLPFYDTLPGRLSAYLHEKYGPLKCLDVGANIGDTIAALYRDQRDLFLAVEPEPKFNRYLHYNWNQPNVRILDTVIAVATGVRAFDVVEKFGTASFYNAARGLELKTTTVDDLLAANPDFADLQLIKVDTDGNDLDVLCGARRALAPQPAVLFECDVFNNTHYVEACLDTLSLFRAAGYRSFLLYEKFGYPMGRYDLTDLAHFRELLFYQLTKKYIYFDILVMKEQDLLQFQASERSFFLDSLWDARLRSTAEKA